MKSNSSLSPIFADGDAGERRERIGQPIPYAEKGKENFGTKRGEKGAEGKTR
jgi:hypothetical protein